MQSWESAAAGAAAGAPAGARGRSVNGPAVKKSGSTLTVAQTAFLQPLQRSDFVSMRPTAAKGAAS